MDASAASTAPPDSWETADLDEPMSRLLLSARRVSSSPDLAEDDPPPLQPPAPARDAAAAAAETAPSTGHRPQLDGRRRGKKWPAALASGEKEEGGSLREDWYVYTCLPSEADLTESKWGRTPEKRQKSLPASSNKQQIPHRSHSHLDQNTGSEGSWAQLAPGRPELANHASMAHSLSTKSGYFVHLSARLRN